MAIQKEVFKRVLSVAQEFVANAQSIHLASIAKSIEQMAGCQIFIEPFRDNGPGGDCIACLATCEPYIVWDLTQSSLKERAFRIRHHFIFYKPCPEDIEAERFRIAHELGHCALHWPLGPRRNRLVKGQIPGVGKMKMYMISFLKEEEMEADAFACLLTAHRLPPKRGTLPEVNDDLLKKVKEFEDRDFLVAF